MNGWQNEEVPVDFMIIGSQHAGALNFYDRLIKHPDIIPAKLREINFFQRGSSFSKGIDFYHSFFPNREEMLQDIRQTGRKKITGEASPSYLFVRQTPQNIRRYFSNMKFIVLLREPITRAYLQYQTLRSNGLEQFSDFQDAVENDLYHQYIARGEYAEQLKNWLKYFDKAQFLIIQSERYFKNPEEVMRETFDFLKVPYVAYNADNNHLQTSRHDDRLLLESPFYNELSSHYREHNEALYDLLSTRFNW